MNYGEAYERGHQGKTFGSFENIDFDYKYPRGLNLRPDSELHNTLLNKILDLCEHSKRVLDGVKDEWKKIDWSLNAYVPLDEALSRVGVDFSGRPGLSYEVDYPRGRIGDFDVDLFGEFFRGFVNHAKVTLHIDNLKGRNAHHVAETIFKAFGRALRMAVEPDDRMQGTIPSTKGSL